MDTHLEIEYKELISKDIYHQIKNNHFNNLSPFTQTNHYFTDCKCILSNLRYSLRVREVNNTFEFTLKIPQSFSKLEMNENITYQEFQNLLNQMPFKSNILEELNKINVTINDLFILTSLTTIRLEKEYKNGILCIDESHYNGKVDYEIEYEAESEEKGKEIFSELLSSYNLTYSSNCPGKFTRAIKTLKAD